VAGAALGVHLNAATPGNTLLIIGIAGILCGYFYSAPPLRLGYRGLGELAVGVGLGVLPVVGSYLVQTHQHSVKALLVSLPLALAVIAILWVNEIVDHEPDRAARKRTLVVLVGLRTAGRAFTLTLFILIYATLFLAVFTASMVPLALVAVLAFGLARTVVGDLWVSYQKPHRLEKAQSAALRFHLVLGIILAASPLVAVLI
jgi:1,4-dihydroxy-2-naphthoate octaprenyltransferase